MAPRIVTLPIANIAISNTTTDLVTRVQTIVDYLNNTPIGNVVSTAGGPILLDDITSQFTGSQTVFTLTSSSAAVNVGTPENLLITLNGTVQDTPDAYSATGGTLTFVDAPYPGTTFYGVIMVSNGATGSGTSDTANNALHLVGKHEAELNVNSALTSNNATYAYGKTEGNLNVNSAVNANNSSYAFGKTEGNLNVNSAVNANNANSIGGNAVRTGTPANADVLTWDTANGYWMPAVGGAGGPHNVLSSTHSDSNTASASRGDIITAQGASPLWSRLTVGTAGQALTSNGTEPGWAAKVNAATNADTANNATNAFGKTEGNLNVNSAVNANTANNATNAFGKSEGNLNVNSAVNANTANNSTYAFGKTEGNLNVNSALLANNSAYAFGKTEGNLNVNGAVTLTGNANVSLVFAGPTLTGGNVGTQSFVGIGDVNPWTSSSFTTISGGSYDLGRIISNALTTYGGYQACITANTVGADQFAEVTLQNTDRTSAWYGGPGVHISEPSMYYWTGYMLTLGNAGGGSGNPYTQMKLYRCPAAWNPAEIAVYNVNTNAGDRIKLRIAGTTLTVSVNGVDLGNVVTDSTYTTGRPAYMGYYFGSPAITAFTWGDGAGLITEAPGAFRSLALTDLPAGIVANNATYAFGKTEGNLNVNSALSSNNSTYLNGNAASNFAMLDANNNFTGANNYFAGNVYVSHLGANTTPHANAVARFGGQYGALLTAAGNLGATPTFDFNLSNEFYGTMTANATFTLSNPIDGHRYCLLINSGAGGFWITWPAACLWGAGGAPGNSLGAGLVDMFTFIYVAATAKYYMSYALGY